ncbi:aminoglycoside adenylyltransferase domain-containing protein [Bacillus sp. PS06]|uniref:aminoglycoside adenylyltransferase domain-containing protein n=1 Tax=Bacillus sp. PS06 TaxID=2764176 RepID=UPI00296FD8FC|nr:aminoglycoside adenylyltransferase domain-containing protein [Bacillus sp. PS06]
MYISWDTSSLDVKNVVHQILRESKGIIRDNFIGLYVHGSLAMGGFNPQSSDIDIIIVTRKLLTVEAKVSLAQLLLRISNNPYPIEISFLNIEHLKKWEHPLSYDFHYSEYWRTRYEVDMAVGTKQYMNNGQQTDPDLAAHITIINHRGICVEGIPITEVFPSVPRADYISSIMGDYSDCLTNIEIEPIYCTLNLIRVYWYLKEDVISSKYEAGIWGASTFPAEIAATVKKVLDCYKDEKGNIEIKRNELLLFRNYIVNQVGNY